MTEKTPEELQNKMIAWAKDHVNTYLTSGGTKGHVMDIRWMDAHRFTTMLLMRYVGRKSGKTMVIGIHYVNVAGEAVIFGSKGGSDQHPEWYLNLKAGSPVAFQVATQAFNATWREPEGKEWDYLSNHLEYVSPHYKKYIRMTERKIPIVLLKAQDEIPVFKKSEIQGGWFA